MNEYSPPIRANCFDASALVKVFTQETGGELVRKYFNQFSSTKYTTPFCFYEALSVLKVKWLYRKELSKEQYTDSAFKMTAWYGATLRLTKVRDIDLVEPIIFFKARELAETYSIDLSDAFQVLSVKEGYFSCLINDSRTVLVTADERLAKIAESEGIKAWCCLKEPMPV